MRAFCWFLLLIYLWGCATFGQKQGWKDEGLLRERVNQCWAAKAAGDWGQVYEMTCRAFKAKTDKGQFLKRANLKVKAFKIEGLTLDEEKREAEVLLSFDTEVMGYSLQGVRIEEIWRFEGGNWFLCPSYEGFKELFKKKEKK